MGRLGDAVSVLRGRKRAADPAVVMGMIRDLLRIGSLTRKGTRELVLMYREQPLLRSVVGRIGDSVARVRLRLYRTKRGGARGLAVREVREAARAGDLVEVEDHPLLAVLRKPNPLLTGRTSRRLQVVHLEVPGESFLVKERNGSGQVVQLWTIPPHWITETPRADWQFYRGSYGSWQKTIPAADVIWRRDPDPENPYGRGSGVGVALQDDLEADEGAAQLARAFFDNGGVPSALMVLENAGQPQLDEAKAFYRTRFGKDGTDKGGIHFVNKKAEYLAIGHKFVDMQLVELRRYEAEILRETYGVPPEILGHVDNSNRATIDAADYLMARYVTEPRVIAEVEDLQMGLVDEADDRLVLGYDSPVPEDREFRLKVHTAAPWAFDVDEHRELGGEEALEDEAQGSLRPVPSGMQFTADLASVQPSPSVQINGTRAAQPDPDPVVFEVTDDDVEEVVDVPNP